MTTVFLARLQPENFMIPLEAVVVDPLGLTIIIIIMLEMWLDCTELCSTSSQLKEQKIMNNNCRRHPRHHRCPHPNSKINLLLLLLLHHHHHHLVWHTWDEAKIWTSRFSATISRWQCSVAICFVFFWLFLFFFFFPSHAETFYFSLIFSPQ